MSTNYDAIVIGAGQAGPALANRLAGASMKVAFIERHKFGGTCVNTGCTPTKAMVASAYAAHLARRGGEYGVNIAAEVRVDMKKVKERKDGIVADSATGVEKWMRGNSNITVYKGHARFESATEVSVGAERFCLEDFYQRRWTRGRAVDAGTGADRISHQQLNDECRFSAATS